MLHVLPTLLRNDASRVRGSAALPLLCAGPLLAYAIAHGHDTLRWVAASAETAGFVVVAWEIVTLVVRAPADRMLLASRFGVLLSTVHAAAALGVGAALADRGWKPLLGIPHDVRRRGAHPGRRPACAAAASLGRARLTPGIAAGTPRTTGSGAATAPEPRARAYAADVSFCQRPNSFPEGSVQWANQPIEGTGIFSPASPPSSRTLPAPASMSSTSK